MWGCSLPASAKPVCSRRLVAEGSGLGTSPRVSQRPALGGNAQAAAWASDRSAGVVCNRAELYRGCVPGGSDLYRTNHLGLASRTDLADRVAAGCRRRVPGRHSLEEVGELTIRALALDLS